jgi:hypothetical protein
MVEWRQSRTQRTRIPESFWLAATEQARVEGVYVVAKALGLKYVTLKARVAAAAAIAPKPQQRQRRGGKPVAVLAAESGRSSAPVAPPVTFVQLPPVTATGPVVELVDARGAKLTIRFAPGAAADVGAVVQAFLGRRSA